MSKQLNAVALANKALRKENEMLWDRVDTLERGVEEKEILFDAMVKQLVMFGRTPANPIYPEYEVKIPKINAEELAKYQLSAQAEEDGLRLKVFIEPPHDEEDEDAESED